MKKETTELLAQSAPSTLPIIINEKNFFVVLRNWEKSLVVQFGVLTSSAAELSAFEYPTNEEQTLKLTKYVEVFLGKIETLLQPLNALSEHALFINISKVSATRCLVAIQTILACVAAIGFMPIYGPLLNRTADSIYRQLRILNKLINLPVVQIAPHFAVLFLATKVTLCCTLTDFYIKDEKLAEAAKIVDIIKEMLLTHSHDKQISSKSSLEYYHSLIAILAIKQGKLRKAYKHASIGETLLEELTKLHEDIGSRLEQAYLLIGKHILYKKNQPSHALYWYERSLEMNRRWSSIRSNQYLNSRIKIIEKEIKTAKIFLFKNKLLQLKQFEIHTLARSSWVPDFDRLRTSIRIDDPNLNLKFTNALTQCHLVATAEGNTFYFCILDINYRQWCLFEHAIRETNTVGADNTVNTSAAKPSETTNPASTDSDREQRTTTDNYSSKFVNKEYLQALPFFGVAPQEMPQPPATKTRITKWNDPTFPPFDLDEDVNTRSFYEIYTGVKKLLRFALPSHDLAEQLKDDTVSKMIDRVARTGNSYYGKQHKGRIGFGFFTKEEKECEKHRNKGFGENCVGKLRFAGKRSGFRIGIYPLCTGTLWVNDKPTDIKCELFGLDNAKSQHNKQK